MAARRVLVFVGVFLACLLCFLGLSSLFRGRDPLTVERRAEQGGSAMKADTAPGATGPTATETKAPPTFQSGPSAAPRPTVASQRVAARARTMAVDDAEAGIRASSMQSNLKTIRSQLELYKVQHNGQWPSDLSVQLTKYTDADGNISDTQNEQFPLGPYLVALPKNPYTGTSEVTTVSDSQAEFEPPEGEGGWWYNSATGEFRCHTADDVLQPNGESVNRM
jgi:general secretion pathway protein G